MQAIPTVSTRPSGKIPTTAVTNELANALLAMFPGLRQGESPDPTTRDGHFIGVVTDTGPKGDEDDYTDERYWIKISVIDGFDSLTDEPAEPDTHITTSFVEEMDDNGDFQEIIITATNLAESYLDKEESGIDAYQSGTHLLPKGSRVHVFALADNARGENGHNVRFFFTRRVEYRVLIVAEATCGGVYEAKFVKGAEADFDPEMAVFDTDHIGAVADSFDCYAVNCFEQGQTTHDLTDGSPISKIFVGSLRSRKSNDDYHVVILNGADQGPCTTP